MADYTGNLIYIGTLADIDTDESDFDVENASGVAGTYSASLENVTVTQTDANEDGQLQEDDQGQTADTFSYTLDGSAEVSGLDSAMRYNATVKLSDGSTQNTQVSVYQVQNGDTFVKLANGMEVTEITLTSVAGDGYSSITAGMATSTAQVVCFTFGTLIDTPDGPRAVETLGPGDRVTTIDRGAQPVLWRGCWTTGGHTGKPLVRLAKGSLGPDVPSHDLIVSRQHRMMIRSDLTRKRFGTPEVLVAAHRLTPLPGITEVQADTETRLVHLLLERHEIVWANGAPTETLLPGPEARKHLGHVATAPLGHWTPARPIPNGKDQRALVAQHRRCGQPLVAAPSSASCRAASPAPIPAWSGRQKA